jgi:hypothetical protein
VNNWWEFGGFCDFLCGDYLAEVCLLENSKEGFSYNI